MNLLRKYVNAIKTYDKWPQFLLRVVIVGIILYGLANAIEIETFNFRVIFR